MQAKALGIIGALVSAAAPVGAGAAETPADVKQLQEENRRLAEQLQSAQAEIRKLKQVTPEPAAAPSASREMSAPFAEETSAEERAPAASSAPSSAGTKDFTLAVGAKVWMTEWSTWRTPGSVPGADKGANIQTITSKASDQVSVIPSLTARYKQFFITGSYLSNTEYLFPEQTQIYTFNNQAVGLAYQLRGSREEWDISLGYQLLPYLAVTGGYKEIRQDFRSVGCTAFIPGGPSLNCAAAGVGLPTVKATYGGPTIGLSGAAPIGNGFGLYGNFNYGWLGANYQHNQYAEPVNNVDYYVGEMGLTYSHLLKEMPVYLPLSSATAYAGYRYQSYKSHLNRSASLGNDPKDTVQGFVAGVNVAF